MRRKRQNLERVDSAREALSQEYQNFTRRFGREPTAEDTVFTLQYLDSDQDIRRQHLQAMRAADIHHELIYTYLKTGIIALEGKVGKNDVRRMRQAHREFNERLENGEDLDDILSHREFGERPLKQLEDIIIVSTHAVVKMAAEWHQSPDSEGIVPFALSFLKSIRTVVILLQNDISYDAMPLLRNALECHLDFCSWVSSDSFRAFSLAMFGVSAGTHVYTGNTRNKNEITCIDSGKVFSLQSRRLRASEIESCSGHIFTILYPTLSDAVHSNLGNVKSFFNENGLDYINADFSEFVFIITFLLLSCHAYEMRRRLSFRSPFCLDVDLSLCRSITELGIFTAYAGSRLDAEVREGIEGFLADVKDGSEGRVSTCASVALDLIRATVPASP